MQKFHVCLSPYKFMLVAAVLYLLSVNNHNGFQVLAQTAAPNSTFTIKINIDNILKEFLEKNSITTSRITLPGTGVTSPGSPTSDSGIVNIVSFPPNGNLSSSVTSNFLALQTAVAGGINGSTGHNSSTNTSTTHGIGGAAQGLVTNGTTRAPVPGRRPRYDRAERMLIAILVLFSILLTIALFWVAMVISKNGCPGLSEAKSAA